MLASGASVQEVADTIVRALRSRRPVASVLADLPERDGRLAADEWMFAPAAGAEAPVTGER